jgi:predicted porin
MKKHLIAAAVAAAVAVPAAAQVTVYGRLDAGYSTTGYSGAEDNSAANASEPSAVSFSNFTSSRLGVRGAEDLGGGLKANFQIETAIGSSRATAAAATKLGDRALWAEIAGSFGAVRVGLMDSLSKGAVDSFDAAGANNLRGSLPTITSDLASGKWDADGNESTATELEFEPRVVGIRFTSPSFSGFTFAASMHQNTTKAEGLDTIKAGNGHEFGLNYSAGNFAAAVAIRKAEFKGVEDGQTVGGVEYSENAEQSTTVVSASYNLGVAKLFGTYFDGEAKDDLLAEYGADTDGYRIGVTVPMGSVSLFAAITDGEVKPKDTAEDKFDIKGHQVGLNYAFSKRTSAYLAYGKDELKGTDGSAKGDQTAIGIIHSF